MLWLIRGLGAAFLTGVGLKLGGDAYELIKKRMRQRHQQLAGDTGVSDAEVGAVLADAGRSDWESR